MTAFRTPRVGVSALFTLLGAGFGAWLSRIPSVAERFGLDHDALGLLLLVHAIGALVAFPFAGPLVDRLGPPRLGRLAIVVVAVAIVLIGLAPNVPSLAAALLLMGFAGGSTDVAINAWAAEAERLAGKPIMSSIHAFFYVGAWLGALSGAGASAASMDYPLHFALFLVVLAPALLWLASGPAAPRAVRTASDREPAVALPPRKLWLLGVLLFCATMGEGGVADWASLLTMEATGAPEAQAAIGFAAFSVAMVATRLVGDAIVAKFGAVATARGAALLAGLGVVVAVTSANLPLMIGALVLMGIGYAPLFPLAITRAGNDETVPPGVAIAGIASFGYGGLLLGPVVIGFVAEATGLRVGFGLLIGLAVIVLVAAPSLASGRAARVAGAREVQNA